MEGRMSVNYPDTSADHVGAVARTPGDMSLTLLETGCIC